MPLDQDITVSVRSVCVYCGSANHVDERYRNTARDVGRQLALQGRKVVYGGGHVGLMGLVADAALDAGGHVIGIIPEHIRALEVQHARLTEMHVVNSMHERKSMMVERSDAFVILPGGFGTLDETFEILTWKQLGLHNKPIIIYNVNGYWDPLMALIERLIDSGFAPSVDRQFYRVVTDLESLTQALDAPCPPPIDPATKWL